MARGTADRLHAIRTRMAGTLCVLCFCVGCGGDETSDAAPIKLGVAMNLSEGSSAHTEPMIQATQFALDEINSAGGLLSGRRVELVVRNTLGLKQRSESVTRELIEDEKVVALLGYDSSGDTIGADTIAFDHEVPLLSCCATADSITTRQPEEDRYLFRTIPPDSLQVPVLGKRAYADGCRKMAIMPVDDAYGLPFGAALRAYLEGEGAEVVAVVPFHREGLPSTEVETVMAETPDCVTIIGFSEDYRQIRQDWASFDGPSVSWYGTDGALGQRLSEPLLDGLIVTSPDLFPSSDRSRRFQDGYEARYHEAPVPFSLNQYDATVAAMLAIEAAGTTDGPKVRDALYDVTRPGNDKLGVEPGLLYEGLTALASGNPIDYQGASGSVDFDDCGNVTTDYTVMRYDAGLDDFELVETIRVPRGVPCP